MDDKYDELCKVIKDHLAVVHRDGGHHTEFVGLIQSIKDATQVYYDLRTSIVETFHGNRI